MKKELQRKGDLRREERKQKIRERMEKELPHPESINRPFRKETYTGLSHLFLVI